MKLEPDIERVPGGDSTSAMMRSQIGGILGLPGKPGDEAPLNAGRTRPRACGWRACCSKARDACSAGERGIELGVFGLPAIGASGAPSAPATGCRGKPRGPIPLAEPGFKPTVAPKLV